MTAVDVTVRTTDALLDGRLAVFPGATAVVAFAHGSGSSRHSPRNRAVAEELNRVGVATLLLDLLTPEEERADSATGRQRFDIDLLTRRLTGTVDWLAGHEDTAGTPIGLFGASTGAAAALRTAAERPDLVAAVVSRGGRPDLAGTEALQVVRAPTLLIVGGADTEVLRLNEDAADRLSAPHRIHVVPRATHLFEEPGALEEVADAASGWFAGILGEAER
ncbi:dienelactone hydrolase family protein [Nocardiopsis dassonvillei]|uniref:dienelactone hydrolase family protein n=1 Tax=Nocardiopsis dassonvillei TaxID=2014 RepID=UPI0020A56F20|nr:alpha/beta family hydrolase [Nocardiopsis dassonvillei]MCP3017063.1 dienelactone hydrolase family protein [Nocardiopsis dassonvillei]